MNVLLVEDEPDLAAYVVRGLTESGIASIMPRAETAAFASPAKAITIC